MDEAGQPPVANAAVAPISRLVKQRTLLQPFGADPKPSAASAAAASAPLAMDINSDVDIINDDSTGNNNANNANTANINHIASASHHNDSSDHIGRDMEYLGLN
jgi:hypothetical protein